MKITIVNGISSQAENAHLSGINDAIAKLGQSNEISLFNIEELSIYHCTGCWSCWIKDPGKCVFDDDMVSVYKSIIKSDMLIFISSVKASFIQSEVKKVIDRMFAVLLPHMTILKGELHHIPRYNNQPTLGLIIAGEASPEKEQCEICNEYMYRLSLNFNKAKKHLLHYYSDNTQKELINEINNI